ncbi:MAG: Gfo/Idh/MocA family oxidoreductase [Planctomycetaceae bacterium]
MPKIKIGQIGVGHAHASGKMGAYRNSSDYEVVGIVEPDPQLRRRAQSQSVYQGLQWMTQEQLLNVDGLRAVAVETRVRDLLDVAEICVRQRLHIHLDKPAGENLPQFKRILDDAQRQHVLVQMGYMYRYNPGFVLLRDFLKRGWLGDPFEVHCVMSKLVGVDSRRGLSEYRGGTMFELGCHVLDQVLACLGPPDKVHAFPRHSAATDDGLADNMLATLEYPRATATVRSSVNEVDGGARRHFCLCGSQGTVHIQPLDNPAARVALSQPRGKYAKGYQDVRFSKYVRYIDDAADMARIIRGEQDADFSYEHDYQVQKTLLLASALPVD